MKPGERLYNKFIEILKKKLISATGYTESISVAHETTVARKGLSDVPDKVHLEVNGNNIENVSNVLTKTKAYTVAGSAFPVINRGKYYRPAFGLLRLCERRRYRISSWRRLEKDRSRNN